MYVSFIGDVKVHSQVHSNYYQKRKVLVNITLTNGRIRVYDTDDPQLVLLVQSWFNENEGWHEIAHLVFRNGFKFNPASPVTPDFSKLMTH